MPAAHRPAPWLTGPLRQRRAPWPLLPLLAALLLSGCAGPLELHPADELDPTPGRGVGAAVRVEGVRVEARADAWTAHPGDLEEELIPILLKVENDAERPLRVRYEDIRLVSDKGTRYAALPPFEAEGAVRQQVEPMAYPASGFWVAPHIWGYYPTLDPFSGPFDFDPAYYATYGPTSRKVELPTADMVAMALPEGVLAPGGRVAGFVYFRRPGEGVKRLTLTFALVDASSADEFGAVEIPFAVED